MIICDSAAKDHLSAASHSDGCIDDAESSVATEYVDARCNFVPFFVSVIVITSIISV